MINCLVLQQVKNTNLDFSTDKKNLSIKYAQAI